MARRNEHSRFLCIIFYTPMAFKFRKDGMSLLACAGVGSQILIKLPSIFLRSPGSNEKKVWMAVLCSSDTMRAS